MIKDKLISTLITVILILIVALFIERCNNGKQVSQKPDTVRIVKIDTIVLEGKIVKKPIPYKVEITDTFYIDTTDVNFTKNCLETTKSHFSKVYYSDSIQVSDSLGMTGVVNTYDTLSQNRIIGRGISYKITYPKIRETITITKPEPKKTMFFIGGAALVNYPFRNIGVEANIGVLNKKNQFYEIGAQSWNNELVYKIGTKIKL